MVLEAEGASVPPAFGARRAGVLPHGAREAAVEVEDSLVVAGAVVAEAVVVVAAVAVVAVDEIWVQKYKD